MRRTLTVLVASAALLVPAGVAQAQSTSNASCNNGKGGTPYEGDSYNGKGNTEKVADSGLCGYKPRNENGGISG